MSLKDLVAPFFVWQRAFEKPYTVSLKPIEERPGAYVQPHKLTCANGSSDSAVWPIFYVIVKQSITKTMI